MLLLDVGNTRIKYRVGNGPMKALVHAGAPQTALADLALGATRIAAVDVTDTVDSVFTAHDVERLRASVEACGVKNAYPEPEKLGADRWAALIGARSLTPNACCIIDVGSAITADVLAADGRHLGGWIAPGLELAIQALAHGTHRARAEAPGVAERGPAANTADAIRSGATHALVGFALRAQAAATTALGCEPEVFVSGGDAPLVVSEFDGATLVDDLVLRGLAVWVASR